MRHTSFQARCRLRLWGSGCTKRPPFAFKNAPPNLACSPADDLRPHGRASAAAVRIPSPHGRCAAAVREALSSASSRGPPLHPRENASASNSLAISQKRPSKIAPQKTTEHSNKDGQNITPPQIITISPFSQRQFPPHTRAFPVGYTSGGGKVRRAYMYHVAYMVVLLQDFQTAVCRAPERVKRRSWSRF